jgi:hypothetical protein
LNGAVSKLQGQTPCFLFPPLCACSARLSLVVGLLFDLVVAADAPPLGAGLAVVVLALALLASLVGAAFSQRINGFGEFN